MTFTELVAEIVSWTKRPDLVAVTNSAVRRNTLKWHRSQKWFKDLAVMTAIANPTPGQAVAVIPIASTFPRWRQFAQLNITGYSKPLDAIVMDDGFDLDGYLRTNVYLVAGTNLNIKWSAGFPTFDAAYYQDPIAIESGYTSWIADDYPDIIICSSVMEILGLNNESEIVKMAAQIVSDQFKLLQINNIEPEGR